MIMYRWVNILNMELPRYQEPPLLFDSDDEHFFENMNRHNLFKFLYIMKYHQYYAFNWLMFVLPPQYHAKLIRSR